MLEHANGSEMLIRAPNKTNVSFTFHKSSSKPTDLTPNCRNEQYNSAKDILPSSILSWQKRSTGGVGRTEVGPTRHGHRASRGSTSSSLCHSYSYSHSYGLWLGLR